MAACGFTPVYGPDGVGNRLLGQIAFAEPDTVNGYNFTKRMEERLGRSVGPFQMDTTIAVSERDLGATSTGDTSRIRLNGTASYKVTSDLDDSVELTGSTFAFTGYSFTGSTAATQAAERDAYERLMIILADQIVDDLLLQAHLLPDLQ